MLLLNVRQWRRLTGNKEIWRRILKSSRPDASCRATEEEEEEEEEEEKKNKEEEEKEEEEEKQEVEEDGEGRRRRSHPKFQNVHSTITANIGHLFMRH